MPEFGTSRTALVDLNVAAIFHALKPVRRRPIQTSTQPRSALTLFLSKLTTRGRFLAACAAGWSGETKFRECGQQAESSYVDSLCLLENVSKRFRWIQGRNRSACPIFLSSLGFFDTFWLFAKSSPVGLALSVLAGIGLAALCWLVTVFYTRLWNTRYRPETRVLGSAVGSAVYLLPI
jgi:hypothetical protein